MSAGGGKEGKHLPPTAGTLIPHVYRAFYSALASKAAITLRPEIPHPVLFYWVCYIVGFSHIFLNSVNTSRDTNFPRLKK